MSLGSSKLPDLRCYIWIFRDLPGVVVAGGGDSTAVVFGRVRPGAPGNAIGGSKMPPKSDAQYCHCGSSSETFFGIDICGVQISVSVISKIGSYSQFVVHLHRLRQ